MAYRSYIRITAADDGKPLGLAGLLPVVDSLNAHVREADEQGWRITFNAARVASHLGKPVIRVEVDEAWQVRLAWHVIYRWLQRTGWSWFADHTSAFRRAL